MASHPPAEAFSSRSAAHQLGFQCLFFPEARKYVSLIEITNAGDPRYTRRVYTTAAQIRTKVGVQLCTLCEVTRVVRDEHDLEMAGDRFSNNGPPDEKVTVSSAAGRERLLPCEGAFNYRLVRNTWGCSYAGSHLRKVGAEK